MRFDVSPQRRPASLTTALGDEALSLIRFGGEDAMNTLFTYKVEAEPESAALNFNFLLGTEAKIAFFTEKDPIYFNGIVTNAAWAAKERGRRVDLELRPWFWLATLRQNQRIFHDQDCIEIITRVLAPYAIAAEGTHLVVHTNKSYPTLEYTVQYRESDFAFVSRLMERFGISYAFRHTEAGHQMVLYDDHNLLPNVPGNRHPFIPVENRHSGDLQHFWEITPEQHMTTGSMRLKDFNYEMPNQAMQVQYGGGLRYRMGNLESYEYPGDYDQRQRGENVVAPLRLQQEQLGDHRITAEGDVFSLKSGEKVEIYHDVKLYLSKWSEFNRLPKILDETAICIAARHEFTVGHYSSGQTQDEQGNDEGGTYEGSYVFQPETSVAFVPPRTTPLPIVHGPQTAFVTGKGEIDVDELGRILVRFHWDLRRDQKDEKNAVSMRCRVSQSWAGKRWGSMTIPRVGMEVIVEFLEGDPDKPIVTGCVYNSANMPGYELPANQTRSVFRTKTHEGFGHNELSFEDAKDKEEVFMRAQKDFNVNVGNDRSVRVKNNDSLWVTNDRSQQIQNDDSLRVKNDRITKVENNDYLNVEGLHHQAFGKHLITKVEDLRSLNVGTNHIVKVGGDSYNTVKGEMVVSAKKSITALTKEHSLMGTNKLVIGGPGGKITIDKSGISIEGMMINIKGFVNMGGFGLPILAPLIGAAKKANPFTEDCHSKEEED